MYLWCSNHVTLNIEPAVTAVLAVFTAVMGVVPKFKLYGGTARENLALQNVQASYSVQCIALVVYIAKLLVCGNWKVRIECIFSNAEKEADLRCSWFLPTL